MVSHSSKMHKDLGAKARKARKLGWTVECTNNDHYRWSKDGITFITATTPSRSGLRQDLARIRRHVGI